MNALSLIAYPDEPLNNIARITCPPLPRYLQCKTLSDSKLWPSAERNGEDKSLGRGTCRETSTREEKRWGSWKVHYFFFSFEVSVYTWRYSNICSVTNGNVKGKPWGHILKVRWALTLWWEGTRCPGTEGQCNIRVTSFPSSDFSRYPFITKQKWRVSAQGRDSN